MRAWRRRSLRFRRRFFAEGAPQSPGRESSLVIFSKTKVDGVAELIARSPEGRAPRALEWTPREMAEMIFALRDGVMMRERISRLRASSIARQRERQLNVARTTLATVYSVELPMQTVTTKPLPDHPSERPSPRESATSPRPVKKKRRRAQIYHHGNRFLPRRSPRDWRDQSLADLHHDQRRASRRCRRPLLPARRCGKRIGRRNYPPSVRSLAVQGAMLAMELPGTVAAGEI